MNAALDPAVSRFAARREEDEEAAEGWRGKVQAFLNLYGFLSQMIPYQDSDLERLYVFLRHLAAKLPRRRSGPAYRFDDEVQLEYYRLQKRVVSGQDYEPVAVSTFLQVADYYLVAQARAGGHTVVTHEVPSASTRRIKIPDARIGLGTKCMTPYEMLRRERARFVLGDASCAFPNRSSA